MQQFKSLQRRLRDFSDARRRVANPKSNACRLTLIQTVDGMQSANGQFSVRPVNQDGNLDL